MNKEKGMFIRISWARIILGNSVNMGGQWNDWISGGSADYEDGRKKILNMSRFEGLRMRDKESSTK